MKNYIYKIISLISIITLTISCGSKAEENKVDLVKTNNDLVEITKNQFDNSKMELGEISLQNFAESIKTNGYIDVPPANKAEVSAFMEGYVKKSPLLIGDKVYKGQLLLTIENPDFIEIQQNYLEVSEQLTYLKSEYERQKTLFEEKITSQKNYLKAESDYKSAKALYNGLEQKLRLLNINPLSVKAGKITSVIPIYAPISGVVATVYTTVGKFMNTSDVLMEIINDDHKHLELVVFEKDALKIKEEQAINFKIPESSSTLYQAKVHLIGKSIDKNRTVKVHGHMEEDNEPFLVGMFVEAEIITGSEQKYALPSSAVLEENENYFILALNDKNDDLFKFDKTQVEIGLKNENWVEIINGDTVLKDKQILIKGAFLPLE
ncbi:efflux RND transporter periplasmic adaptor subunit [Lutibacter sp. B1]|uniref:efflux RND transporter periplasmic adaptor subunit n=1 Tax=Lutibacter sp. B1 TaxID=2725996 RepID=UPI00145743D7|nr:efflux RND transporter periplasmic adaptor subunit [Lutibacter sp. B1]NLP58105.1 efflux RND transporter periplasmic adaptor subunit [Lutibacter sp. B1]